MCGRYSFGYPDRIEERVERANIALDEVRRGRQSTISFNVSPGRWGPVYRNDDTQRDSAHSSRRVMEWMRWGLIPSFMAEDRISSTFNCRDDSLTKAKSLWAGVKQHNRCIVLAEGYYEWLKKSDNKRIPHFVKRKDGQLLFMAGFWDRNTKAMENNEEMYTYTVITTHAHKDISWLHDRMPVILDPEQVDDWLCSTKWNSDPDHFMSLLKPFDATRLDVYQVTPDVGKLSNDYPELTQPLKEAKGTINNFFKQKRPAEGDAKEVKKPKTEKPKNKEASTTLDKSKEEPTTPHKPRSPETKTKPKVPKSDKNDTKKITSFFKAT